MIGLIFATIWEARPFLLASQAQVIEKTPFAIYQSDAHAQLLVAVSRIGKVAAAATAQALILTHKVTRLINAGACGALHNGEGLAIGSLLQISEALEGDHEVFGKRPQPIACTLSASLGLPAVRLVTNDRPVFDIQTRAALAQLGDVADMEGAAVARVANYYQVPCTLIKGITDNAQPLDRQTLLDNLNMVSEQIAQKLWGNVWRI
jgi:adenosylhomocysteine nucleosidase